jgi:hypothetical protein
LRGIDDFEIPAFRIDLFLDSGGKGLRRFKTESGGDAVAQNQDDLRSGRGGDESQQQETGGGPPRHSLCCRSKMSRVKYPCQWNASPSAAREPTPHENYDPINRRAFEQGF